MVKWLLILSLGGNRIETRVVSSHDYLEECTKAGKYERYIWATRGVPTHFACIETKR